MKPTCRILWALNLLMSDLTFGPSNDGSLALVRCLSGGYRFASVLRCVGLVYYLGFYVAFNTLQVISRWVVGRPEETSTYS